MPINNAVTRWLASKIEARARRIIARRPPDFIVGSAADPYLLRWWVLPRNSLFNVYVHIFNKSDQDRALHDHPFHSVSLALSGPMGEVIRCHDGSETMRLVSAGDLVFRSATHAHRMVIGVPGRATLFITGPRVREWASTRQLVGLNGRNS